MKAVIFGKFRGKIEILSTCNRFCWKSAAVSRNSVGNLQCRFKKLLLPALPTFLTLDAAGSTLISVVLLNEPVRGCCCGRFELYMG